jgi:hypothetical protein
MRASVRDSRAVQTRRPHSGHSRPACPNHRHDNCATGDKLQIGRARIQPHHTQPREAQVEVKYQDHRRSNTYSRINSRTSSDRAMVFIVPSQFDFALNTPFGDRVSHLVVRYQDVQFRMSQLPADREQRAVDITCWLPFVAGRLRRRPFRQARMRCALRRDRQH